MRMLKSILWIAIFLLLLIASIQNYPSLSQTVTFRLNLLFIKFESYPIPIGAYFIIFFLIGFIIGMFSIVGIKVRGRLKKSKEKEAPKTTQSEKKEKESETQNL